MTNVICSCLLRLVNSNRMSTIVPCTIGQCDLGYSLYCCIISTKHNNSNSNNTNNSNHNNNNIIIIILNYRFSHDVDTHTYNIYIFIRDSELIEEEECFYSTIQCKTMVRLII